MGGRRRRAQPRRSRSGSRPRRSVTLKLSSSAIALPPVARAERSMRMEGLQGARALVYNALSAPRPLMANSAGVRFDALLSLMARLRGEGGCPWDREQTRASLKPYLIEEAYEVLQAIDEDDTGHLAEELGDLLFQVVFHSQVAAEAGEFTMSDVLDRLIEKMTRRHPHVFGDRAVADARDALRQWERIKRDEGDPAGEPRSALDGVPAEPPRAPPRPAPSGQGRARGLRLANLAAGVGQGARGDGGDGRSARHRRRRDGSATSSATCCFPWSTWHACWTSTLRTACVRRPISSPAASTRWRPT